MFITQSLGSSDQCQNHARWLLLGFRIAVVSEAGLGSCFSILLDPSASAPSSYAEAASETANSDALCA